MLSIICIINSYKIKLHFSILTTYEMLHIYHMAIIEGILLFNEIWSIYIVHRLKYCIVTYRP